MLDALFEHDLFRKPLHTPDQVRGRHFRDHALAVEVRMELTPQDRLVPEVKPEGRSVWFAALAVATLAVAVAVVLIPQARESAKGIFYAARDALGLGPSDVYAA